MNVILPRYAGAIAESVVNEPVEVDIAVDEVVSTTAVINAAATKTDGLGCHAGAAELNTCFLRDTTENIAAVAARSDAAGLVCYTPAGDESAFEGLLPSSFSLIVQRGDGFGERLLAAAEDILSCGFGAVCLIDSDSPTIPSAALEQAVQSLRQPGDRLVLGPSDDGGYYLIGLKRAHAAPFEGITWSTGSVYAETLERVSEAGLELVQLPTWYDVDDGTTLAVLEAELLDGVRPIFATMPGYPAEATRKFLEQRRRANRSGDNVSAEVTA